MQPSDLTGMRWRIQNDPLYSKLPEKDKEWMLAQIFEGLGYGPPLDNEADRGATDAEPEPFIDQVNFPEVWHKGNIRYSKARNERWGFCFHHTAGRIAGSISWIKQGLVPASYHMAVSPNGTQNRFVDDRFRSYSAGHGTFKGRNPNHVLIHVAVEGDTVSGKNRDQREITDIEMESIMDWCVPRFKQFNMKIENCTDHRTVDSRRRNDLAPDQFERIISELKARTS